MAYIYQITNDVNGKIYIGKTERSIQKRWSEHCRDRDKEEYQNRPLYRAMNKYGIKHFHIEVLEETDNPEEREIYWIEQKRSFKYGYNATCGGDGKRYLDYDLIIATYQATKNVYEVARILNYSSDSIYKVLKSYNINILSTAEVNQQKSGIVINQYDLNDNYIQSFPSYKSAARALGKITNTSRGAASHIADVCKGKRKTAYGYKWKILN